MADLHELVRAANEWLDLDAVPDYPGALNGLQLENGGRVQRIAAAVDACLPVIEEACAAGADLLVVHHGLFWQGAQRIEGALYRKLKLAMDHGLAIYSAHLPLDVHPELGNNARLLAALGCEGRGRPFAPWKGLHVGLRVSLDLDRDELLAKVANAVGAEPKLAPGGPARVRELGVITGGAGSQIHELAATGIDTFLTGEGPHWSYTAAEELGVNLVYAGHYATETFGVKALAERWAKEFDGLEVQFIDHPTGL
ncbi:MAG TPA: Nif3-like dinuclear metal center hexameric protein [Bacteroidia bacterium]|nr:Nif3-like dinuclear metal center hexameric protein [Bacteroidia bacterium]